MYPRIKISREGNKTEYIESFFTHDQSVEFDIDKCVGCWTCARVCPVNAIANPSLEGKIRVKTEDLIPGIPDPAACSYCGTCAYMCPYSAITLKKKGVPVALDNIEIVMKKVLPRLEYNTVNCEKANIQAKVYVEGSINVDWNKCISCMSCESVCPTGAFFKSDEERTNEQGKKLKVDLNASKCIKCRTCEHSCSKKAITVNVEKVNYSGEFKEIFWPPLIERLKE
jgi:formate hydrogenlyase subunit 6/NADH:ubiquinone oxidoreductase subunit I